MSHIEVNIEDATPWCMSQGKRYSIVHVTWTRLQCSGVWLEISELFRLCILMYSASVRYCGPFFGRPLFSSQKTCTSFLPQQRELGVFSHKRPGAGRFPGSREGALKAKLPGTDLQARCPGTGVKAKFLVLSQFTSNSSQISFQQTCVYFFL